MPTISPTSAEHRQDMKRVLRILEDTPPIDRTLSVPREEFQARVKNVNAALQRHGHRCWRCAGLEHTRQVWSACGEALATDGERSGVGARAAATAMKLRRCLPEDQWDSWGAEEWPVTRIQNLSILCLITGLTASAVARAAPPESAGSAVMLLRQGWSIQASADVHETGAAISTPGFKVQDWYAATLPSTVLSALVEDRLYPDPYTGMNLRSIPGTTYPIFSNFSETLMPPGSPFRKSWWFRTDF